MFYGTTESLSAFVARFLEVKIKALQLYQHPVLLLEL